MPAACAAHNAAGNKFNFIDKRSDQTVQLKLTIQQLKGFTA